MNQWAYHRRRKYSHCMCPKTHPQQRPPATLDAGRRRKPRLDVLVGRWLTHPVARVRVIGVEKAGELEEYADGRHLGGEVKPQSGLHEHGGTATAPGALQSLSGPASWRCFVIGIATSSYRDQLSVADGHEANKEQANTWRGARRKSGSKIS